MSSQKMNRDQYMACDVIDGLVVQHFKKTDQQVNDKKITQALNVCVQ